MNRAIKIFSVFVFLFIIIPDGVLQKSEKESLIEKKRLIEKELEFTNRLLTDTRNKRENTIQELRLLKAQIRKRNTLINTLNVEISGLEKEIQDKTNKLQSLRGELEITRNEYSDLIYHAFKNRNANLDFMYLLASADVSQFYSRYLYLQQYKDYRLKSIKLIVKLEQLIEVEITNLSNRKREKINTINKMLAEKAILVKDEQEIDNVVNTLKTQEVSLKQDIEEKKKVKEKLEKQIESIIKNEAKKKRYENLTPAEKIISDDFVKNKGRLPWPTEMGIITDGFGEHDHPVMKIKVRNNGIDITTVPQAKARAVFNGVVTKVFSIKGANSTVIIRHGNYYTVYHNLKEVFVNAGDTVTTKEYIGIIFTDSKKGESIFHFEVWKELEKQNPEDWLSN